MCRYVDLFVCVLFVDVDVYTKLLQMHTRIYIIVSWFGDMYARDTSHQVVKDLTFVHFSICA